MPKKRLDVLLVERGLAESRAQAQALVLAGLVPGHDEAGRAGRRGRRARRSSAPPPYVSRGGDKLANALDAFGVDPAGRDCLDVGASTGGFTDVLLQRGAARVIALDVGYGQLHPRIRDDPRVTVLERTNARDADASCRSRRSSSPATSRSSRVRTALPPALALAAPGWQALVLVKPQFEAGRARGAEGRRPRPGGPPARRCARSPRRRSPGGRDVAGRRRLGPARPEGQPRVLPPPRPRASGPSSPTSSTRWIADAVG